MLICMMLMDYVFSCFLWFVCDFVGKFGKQVELVMFGQVIEFDKSLIEWIIDLFMYLVCNSFDYGIEIVDKCVVVGKDVVGQFVLLVVYYGGNIVIEVSDDGVGLNCEWIFVKVVKQGMQIVENISDDEVW